MKKKIIVIVSLIIIILSALIILYKNRVHYTMEIDGVKLALTLDNNSIDYIPKDNDYYVDIDCTNVTGEYLYDEDEETFKLSFKNIKSGAKCSLAFTSNPNTLIDIMEDEGYLEEEIPSGYAKIGQSGYTGNAPTSAFYNTSFSSSATSGDTDPDASLTFDTTNNMWVTGNLTQSRYYYYFFTVSSAGSYQFCFSKNSGNYNYLYIYKGTTNMLDLSYTQILTNNEKCFGIGNLTTSDVIKVVQYTYTSASNVSSVNFGLKKSSSTTDAGYRYGGTNPNNYVWFNNDLWRIIGSIPTKIDVNNSTSVLNLIKIIKAEPIGISVWHNSYTKPNWDQSSLYTLLNNYYYGAQNATGTSSCYGDTGSVSKCDYRYNGIKPMSYYGSMVKEVYWNTGITGSKINPLQAYADETLIQSSKGFVGIMNMSDYGFATDYNRPYRTTMASYSNENYIKNDWLSGHGMEWTIDYSPSNDNNANIIYARGDSYGGNVVTLSSNIRPVVYLDPSVYVVSGDGTRATPYKIAWPTGS